MGHRRNYGDLVMTLPKRSEGPPSGIPAWASRGRKIGCVDANWSSIPPAHPLTAGAEYTIESVVEENRGTGGLEIWVTLAEAVNPIEPGWGFSLRRFRPLSSVEADLEAHFSQLLHVPSTHTVDA